MKNLKNYQTFFKQSSSTNDENPNYISQTEWGIDVPFTKPTNSLCLSKTFVIILEQMAYEKNEVAQLVLNNIGKQLNTQYNYYTISNYIPQMTTILVLSVEQIERLSSLGLTVDKSTFQKVDLRLAIRDILLNIPYPFPEDEISEFIELFLEIRKKQNL